MVRIKEVHKKQEMQTKLKPYKRCRRCGSPIVYGGRGPYPIYCDLCGKRRHYERTHKFTLEKQRKEKGLMDNLYKYVDYPTQYDDCGAFVDQTHANWDTFISGGVCIKYLGTVSEWDLDKREYELRKKHGLLKK